MRCDGGLPFCGRCITHSRTKSCAYVDPPKRSPITRQYVSSLEAQLEEAKKKIANFESKMTQDKKPNSNTLDDKGKSPAVKTEASSSDSHPNAMPISRSRAATLAGDSVTPLKSPNSKKRSRTASQSSDDEEDFTEPCSAPQFTDSPFNGLHIAHHSPAIRGALPQSKSLVEKVDDGMGAGGFISLSSCTAVLTVATQLNKSLAQGEFQSVQPYSPFKSPSDTLEAPPDLSSQPNDDCHALAGRTFSDRLLPAGTDVFTWDATSKRVCAELVDSYFRLHHPVYPILHASTLKSQLNGTAPKPVAASWTMLVNMVFALGAFESKTSSEDSDDDLHYYGVARKCFDTAAFEKEHIVTVQALTLMANYCQKRNYFSAAWMILGSAIRMAISLGLHLENPPNSKPKSPLEREFNRRLWWTLYTMEADCCISMGRPNSLIGLNADTALPRNIDEANTPLNSLDTLPEKKEPTMVSTLISHAKFASEISMPVQSRLIRSPNPTIEEIRAFDLRIQDFIDKLPPYMQEEQVKNGPVWFIHAANRLRWRCNNLRMVMFRPFLLSAALSASAARKRGAARPALRPAVKQAIALCRELAKSNIGSITKYWESQEHNQAASWHGVYFLLQGAFIPLVSLLDEPRAPQADEWISTLNTVKAVLEDMGQITPVGLKCRDAIQSLSSSVVELHASRNAMSFRDSIAEVESVLWQQPYAASASSDGTDLSDVTGPPTLAFSIGSVGSDGAAGLDLRSQSMNESPDHRPSLAESMDAWAGLRPTTASQWSDNGSHMSFNQDSHGGDARFVSRERQTSSAADWTFHFETGAQPPSAATADPLFSQFDSRSQPAGWAGSSNNQQPSWWSHITTMASTEERMPDPSSSFQHQHDDTYFSHPPFSF